jgi:hypothetical protein
MIGVVISIVQSLQNRQNRRYRGISKALTEHLSVTQVPGTSFEIYLGAPEPNSTSSISPRRHGNGPGGESLARSNPVLWTGNRICHWAAASALKLRSVDEPLFLEQLAHQCRLRIQPVAERAPRGPRPCGRRRDRYIRSRRSERPSRRGAIARSGVDGSAQLARDERVNLSIQRRTA